MGRRDFEGSNSMGRSTVGVLYVASMYTQMDDPLLYSFARAQAPAPHKASPVCCEPHSRPSGKGHSLSQCGGVCTAGNNHEPMLLIVTGGDLGLSKETYSHPYRTIPAEDAGSIVGQNSHRSGWECYTKFRFGYEYLTGISVFAARVRHVYTMYIHTCTFTTWCTVRDIY